MKVHGGRNKRVLGPFFFFFTVKLQKCSVDLETSPAFKSVLREEMMTEL